MCPFELSLELALWADIVVGDYNYAFDPRVRLRRLEVDPADHARWMIEEALAKIEGREPESQPVEPTLIVGESCGEGRGGNG